SRRCVDALTLGEHATSARAGNSQRPIRPSLIDPAIDVLLIEPDQTSEKRQPVIRLEQLRSRALDDVERRRVFALRLPGLFLGNGHAPETLMCRPWKGRAVLGAGQRLVEETRRLVEAIAPECYLRVA